MMKIAWYKKVSFNWDMYNKARGFTLIELLVVIAIIGILAGIVLAALGTSRAGGTDAKRISETRQIQYALEIYFNKYLVYPACLYSGTPAGCTGNAALNTATGGMPNVPPGYAYAGLGSGGACSSYHLGISLGIITNQILANATDKDSAAAGTVCTNSNADFSGLSDNAGGTACDNVTPGTGQPGGTETCYDVTRF